MKSEKLIKSYLDTHIGLSDETMRRKKEVKPKIVKPVIRKGV